MWNSPDCTPLTRSSSAAPGNAFEIDNISAGNIPPPSLSEPIKGTLSVHDADIGDALTAFVTGNATIEYNGSSSVPGNIDISALVNAADVTFDTASSNGGTVALNWTYHPINANLDFLHAGDILKIKFLAEVSDGHGHTGSQPLTITLVGAGNTANASLGVAAGPVIDTDAVSLTENGDGTTTMSGLHVSDGDATAANDTFTVGATASSAGGSVIPPPANGSLDGRQRHADNGIRYDPGNDPSQTDMVTLNVSDGLGHSDTVHFVFNEAGQGPCDIDRHIRQGRYFRDRFRRYVDRRCGRRSVHFCPGTEPRAPTRSRISRPARTTSICGCSPKCGLREYQWLAAHHAVQSSTNPADILITLGDETLTLKNVTVTSLHAGDFIVSPHHVV